MLALVAVGTPAAREVLAAHEKREIDAELQLLARCGLAALGDAQMRNVVEPNALGASAWPSHIRAPCSGLERGLIWPSLSASILRT
jgi:hypothetical protein